ncbi:zinc transport system ATP-binding protein [Dysgonomonas sp. PH5-45]|uniref:metal ABC transporter ATP-binding protein n=1 Tax=unclassified Dysgonomonas TaxID=2630389 RepID=UPI002476D102|nr:MULTISPECIES: ABC transporter ATP-binding protein [unclassified Dysgonomonas]MDH6354216.1 zinc transport system ATP-binding protein [Dysgonomonas sp. PH5-45]MDH6387117.1 zinc transport system ATP-binding protein [Dysgonomonas sp. PH5-37]
MNKIIEIHDVSVGYKNKPDVLKNINLDVFPNDFLGIIGPNGGGKTTLLRTILGAIKPSKGKIIFSKNGKTVRQLNIGYLPQINKIDKNFPISVMEVILSGLTINRSFLSSYTKQQKDHASDIASQMGVLDLLHRPIGQLSGGQLQRTLLGRAIVDSPDLLILDEPNSYVDKRFESNFYNILETINQNTSIILVSHDIGTILPLVKNIACVNEGLHYHSGRNISAEWLERTYTSCPIELITHGSFPHRVLDKHEGCKCCDDDIESP